MMKEFKENYLNQNERMNPKLENMLKSMQSDLAKNPAFPKTDADGNPINFIELIGYKRFLDVIEKVKRYTNLQNVTGDGLGQLSSILMQGVQFIQQVEAPHKRELENLAVDLVVEEMEIPDGLFQFQCKLVPVGSINQDRFQKDAKQVEIPADELFEDEKHKRRFINMLIQGSSKKGHYMFELVRKKINEYNPNLAENYGKMMSINDLIYWLLDDETIQQMASNPSTMAGKEEIEEGEQGGSIIKTEAICFPVSIHEIIKGIMEVFGTQGLPDDTQQAEMVINAVDSLSNETMDLRLGTIIWENFYRAYPTFILEEGNRYLQHYLFARYCALPTDEFFRVSRLIMSNNPKGSKYLLEMVEEIQSDLQRKDYETNIDDINLDDLLGYSIGGEIESRNVGVAKRMKIKSWYTKNFPKDDLGQNINNNITFWSLWTYISQGYDVYKILGVNDSFVRENVFKKLSDILGVDYDVIYNKWLKSENKYRKGGRVKTIKESDIKVGEKFILIDGEIIEINRLFVENNDENWVEFSRDGEIFENSVNSLKNFINNWRADKKENGGMAGLSEVSGMFPNPLPMSTIQPMANGGKIYGKNIFNLILPIGFYVRINPSYTATIRNLNDFKNYLKRKDEIFGKQFGEITNIDKSASKEWVDELNYLIAEKKAELKNEEIIKYEIGQPITIFRNQAEREGVVIAVIDNEILVEYIMPNGTSALNIINTSLPEYDKNNYKKNYIPISYDNARISKKWNSKIDTNRLINNPQGSAKRFADGGEINSKKNYDVYDNKRMLLNQANEIEHHSEELNEQVKITKQVPAWVISKMERATTDLSDITHYLDGENKLVDGGQLTDGDIQYKIIPFRNKKTFFVVKATYKKNQNYLYPLNEIIFGFDGNVLEFQNVSLAKKFISKIEPKYPYGIPKANAGMLLLASQLLQQQQQSKQEPQQQSHIVYYVPKPVEKPVIETINEIPERNQDITQDLPLMAYGGDIDKDYVPHSDFCITNLLHLANDIQKIKYYVTHKFDKKDFEYKSYKGRLIIIFDEPASINVVSAITKFIERAEDCHHIFEQSTNVSGSNPNQVFINLLIDKFTNIEFGLGGKVYEFAPKKINLNKTKHIKTNDGEFVLGLISENFVYFINSDKGDENSNTIMYNKKGELLSDNYFANNDLFETLKNESKFEFIHSDLKVFKENEKINLKK